MILLVAEYHEGKVAKSTYELITAARQMGREGPVTALVLGSNIAAIASEVAKSVDQVLVADLPALAAYDPELWAAAVAQIAGEGEASTILIAGTRSGREYSPRVAVKLNAPLIEDAIQIKDAGGALQAEHYTYLARVTEHVEAQGPVIVVTIKTGSFDATKPGTEVAEQYDVDVELPKARVTVTGRTTEKSERISLADADMVVAGGRGLGSGEQFVTLVEGLADQIGAAVGATRAIVDAGWRPYAEQVGQTGRTVQPKAYFALGISGAVQHISGMGKSKLIIAINKDKEAPIFRVADYGIVGDVGTIVPAILAELRK